MLPACVGLYVNQYPHKIWDQPTAPRENVDLFAAITAFSLVEIVSLLGDTIHPWIVERIHQELDRRIIQVYFHDPVPQNWEMKTNNWPAVCAAGIGATVIYIEKDSDRLAGMLWIIIESMRNHLKGFDEEGATSEGVAYWQFGFGFYVYFSELLKERTGGRVNLLEGERVGRIARFPNVCLLSEGKVVNFSDSMEEVEFTLGLFSRLKQQFPGVIVPQQEPHVNQLFNYWANASRILLWTLEEEKNSSLQSGNGSLSTAAEGSGSHDDTYYTGHQWAISKSSTASGLIAFAAKGGHNAEPHNHNDLGHFILHVKGDTILADIGAGLYTRQYFQMDTRYETLTAGSHGHSVPIVDGCRQSQGQLFHADVLHYEKSLEQVKYKLDLTQAYQCPNLSSLIREFTWDRSKEGGYSLTLRDSVQFAQQPDSLVEVLISAVKPVVIEPGYVQLESVDMTYDVEQYELEIDPQQVVAINGVERTIYRLLLSAKKLEKQLEFKVEFIVAR
ncbi:Heparinase II/III-like protein [compost metagenome]